MPRYPTAAALMALALSTGCASIPEPEPLAAKSLPVGTCINMGNTFEYGQAGPAGGPNGEKADFQRIAAAGFDTVRIPVRWDNHSDPKPPHAIDPAWLDRVQRAVDDALGAGLNVILNSHHFEPIYSEPAATAPWHAAVWRQVAARFAKYPESRLWFELENEPHANFTNANLLDTLTPSFEAVRATNPTRAVILGGGNWSGIDSLADLPMFDDPNVWPTFHYYEPFAFTHQGASWVAPDIPPPGRGYPDADDAERLVRDVAKIRDYAARTGKIPFMGETGAYEAHIPLATRVAYTKAVHDAFAPLGVGVCTWAYANTFPFYDAKAGTWMPGMRAALGLKE